MWDRLTRTEAPSIVPVGLDVVKAHLRVGHAEEDSLIQRLLNAAVAAIDGKDGIGYCLMTQTWALTLDEFPDDCIQIPLVPLRDVTSIAYLDVDGASQTMDAADYSVIAGASPALIETAFGGSWPGTRDQRGAVTVTFRAGHAAPADVPADLVNAVLSLVAHWYDHRETIMEGARLAEVPMLTQATLERYRVGRVAA